MPLFRNLLAGSRLALFLPVDYDEFRFRPVEILLLLVANFVVNAAAELIFWWPVSGVEPWGLTAFLANWSVSILALYAGVLLIFRGIRFPELLLMTLAGLPVTTLAWVPIMLLQPWYELAAATRWVLIGLYTIWIVALIMRAAARLDGERVRHGFVPAILYAAAALGATIWPGDYPIFRKDVAYREETETYARMDIESLYYAQPAMMADALETLRPGIPGRTELFAVIAAYYPNEGVFLREAEAVTSILADRFDAGGRIVTLANSSRDPRRYPMANRHNLGTALNAIAAQIDNGEDVLLVYITSHGSRELISAGYWEAATPPLSGEDLALLLDGSGIENVVAVIGACKSGSFLPLLEREDRLVITASAADRNSFGCADDNEWTYFGEAFFGSALRETADLNVAFERAVEIVSSWETEAGHDPSLPQRAAGARIAPRLRALDADARTR